MDDEKTDHGRMRPDIVRITGAFGFYGYAYLSYVPLLGQDSRIRLYNNQGGLIYESTYQKNSE